MLTGLLAAALIALCSAAALISVAAVWRLTGRRRRMDAAPAEPVSVLKPLCGADESLEANLESFFAQRHPDFELVFGVEDAADPAAAVARRLIARHPEARARLVVHGRRGLNPKIANLRGILAAGAHDLVAVSDSNVAVGPDWLARVTAELAGSAPEPGLVTNLFAGTGARTPGAALECAQLSGPVAGSIASSELLGGGSAVLVGKSMLFRRSVFERLGGLESLTCVLAEDYVMGRMFKEAGYRVRVSAEVVHNVTVRTTVAAFLARQLRWATLRSRLKPLLYPFELAINPAAVALAALALGCGPWVLAWAPALTLARDGLQWLRLRGTGGLWATALGPLRDLLLIGVWAAAPFLGTVRWRGRRLRISAGTRVYASAPLA